MAFVDGPQRKLCSIFDAYERTKLRTDPSLGEIHSLLFGASGFLIYILLRHYERSTILFYIFQLVAVINQVRLVHARNRRRLGLRHPEIWPVVAFPSTQPSGSSWEIKTGIMGRDARPTAAAVCLSFRANEAYSCSSMICGICVYVAALFSSYMVYYSSIVQQIYFDVDRA